MNVFDFFGSAVCHQMAERSFFWGSCQSPLCARCTAIEGGIVLGVIFLWLAGRKDGNRPFSPSGMVLAALSFLPIAIDGVGSYLGFWQSNNLLRVLTGALAGYGLPGLFLLAANFSPAKENINPVYKNTGEQIGLLLAAVAYGLLVWLGILPYFLVFLCHWREDFSLYLWWQQLCKEFHRESKKSCFFPWGTSIMERNGFFD